MEQTGTKGAVLLPALKILLFMYAVTGVLLVALAAMLMKFQLTENVVNMGIVVIYVVSGFVGGLLAGKRMKNRKFLWGMILGAGYFLVLTVGSVVFHKGMDMDMERFITTMVMCVASGMIGGITS